MKYSSIGRIHHSKFCMSHRNLAGGGSLLTTISRSQHCCCLVGGDSMTLLICLDGGGTGRCRGLVAVTPYFGNSMAWYSTHYSCGDRIKGAWG